MCRLGLWGLLKGLGLGLGFDFDFDWYLHWDGFALGAWMHWVGSYTCHDGFWGFLEFAYGGR